MCMKWLLIIRHVNSVEQCQTVSNSVNSVNGYSAVLPPSPMVFFKSSYMCICYPFLPFSCATRFPERTYLFVNSFGGLEAFLWSSSLNHPLTPICEGVRSHTTALSHKRIQHNVLDEHFNSKLQIYYIYQLSGIHTARNIWTTLPSITFHPVNIAGID